MQVLLSTLKEELATAQRLEKRYLKKLQKLPRGSFIVRTMGSRRYGYLTYRDEGKVKQDYLGAVDDQLISRYRSFAEERKALKAKLKSVREQLKILRRAVYGRTASTRR